MNLKPYIQKAAFGDRLAQNVLFEYYGPKMEGVAQKFLKDPRDVQDVIMEGFFEFFQKLMTWFEYKSDPQTEAMIYKIIRHRSIKLKITLNGGKSKDEETRNRKRGLVVAFLSCEDVDEPGIDPAILQQQDHEAIMQLINTLPEGYREVIHLYAIEGFDHNEIAEILEISPGTSHSQLSHARTALKELLTTKKVQNGTEK